MTTYNSLFNFFAWILDKINFKPTPESTSGQTLSVGHHNSSVIKALTPNFTCIG